MPDDARRTDGARIISGLRDAVAGRVQVSDLAPRTPAACLSREPGFYRLRWHDGRMAIGYLHTRDEPRPWDTDPPERWSVLFIHGTLVGDSAAYAIAKNIPDGDIGERIEWLK